MGKVEPPEYDENGTRSVRVSQFTIKNNCNLGMFVGEEIEDMYVDDHGCLVVEITDEDS